MMFTLAHRLKVLTAATLILANANDHSLQGASALPAVELKLAFPNLVVNRPLAICEAPDKTGRLFLIDQAGRLLILPKDRNGSETQVFFDISDRKPYVDNEEGLLGFAFHPKYASNGRFYVYYSQQNPRRSVVSEFKVSSNDPNKADPKSERILMEIPQPYPNHNGGTAIFGPDGFLYIALGDGGAANDPQNNAQNLSRLLGKVLRIDVDSKSGELAYGIPKDNPFVGQSEACPEIFAYGVRNPWRMSFDQKTGLLWAGDVGQNKWEEVDIIAKGGNYGWRVREAFHPFNTNDVVKGPYVEPLIEYPHNPAWSTNHLPGLSITGGYVYRGSKLPGLQGVYLYADYAMGTIWGLRYEDGRVIANGPLHVHPKGVMPIRNVAGFGEDSHGEVFIVTFEGDNGKVGRIYEFHESGKTATK
ncbi:MAG: PQQ-dependent sugar dehydrogenase [Opitutaceae bacterium]|nr:PQQ-dependent sugar dehydrogenase [Verrucomicrobiales bacterium]